MGSRILLIVFSSLLLMCSAEDKVENNAIQTGELQYQVPAEWVAETPTGSMRQAQFRLPGANAATAAELALFHFPGSGGSIEANLERWYSQFSQPDGSSTAAKADRKQLKINGLPVTVVYVTGTFHQSGMAPQMGHSSPELPGFALLAAIVETAHGPWFFKTTGPQATIDHWRPAFEKFVQSFKLVSLKAV